MTLDPSSASVSGASGPPVGPPRRRRPDRRLLAAILVIVLAVLIGGIPRWRARAALVAETREMAIPVVRVVQAKAGKPPSAPSLPAEVKPFAEASILARASGYVKRWTTDIGGTVDAGTLLAEIESPELEHDLSRARQELAQAEAALTLARSTAERYQVLARIPGASSVSDQEVLEKSGDLALKSAALEAARFNVRRLDQLQSYTRIRAPFAGVVTARRIDVGDMIVGGGARELFRIAQSGALRVFVRVPQISAGGIAAGQPAEVLIPELGEKAFPATVARTAGAISPESRTLLVELALPNPRGEILAGSYAEARLLGSRPPAPLTLPANTLLFREEGPRVGVVGKEGRVELRSVGLGRDFGRTLEVLSGVGPDDRVILNPSDSLSEGAVVRIAAERGDEGKK
jgi:RND family efflux transporter MFP subunit